MSSPRESMSDAIANAVEPFVEDAFKAGLAKGKQMDAYVYQTALLTWQELDDWLNQQGAEGWRLVCIVGSPGTGNAVRVTMERNAR